MGLREEIQKMNEMSKTLNKRGCSLPLALLPQSPYHKESTGDLHPDGHRATSDEPKHGVKDFEKRAGLGQDDPGTEVAVDIGPAELGFQLSP